MPVCSNCGSTDFVWAENLKTGTIGRGTLSLRSGGELAIGTRVCRGCGHADLFVKDPTVLRQPHTWKPGEFVPIPHRPPADPRPATPTPSPSVPTPAPGPVAPEPSPPASPAVEPVGSPPTEGGAAPADAAPAPTEAPSASRAKRPARRKNTKAKSGETNPILNE